MKKMFKVLLFPIWLVLEVVVFVLKLVMVLSSLICTPNTGHPVLGVFLCDTVMNTRRCASNYIDKENGSRHQKE